MTLKHARVLLLTAIVAGASVSTALAQESRRLSFEITVDGAVVARPEVKLEEDGEVAMVLGAKPAQIRVTLTPTVRGDDIDIAFDITDGDKHLVPTLRISKTAQGSIEWTSPAHRQKTVRLAVSVR